MKLKKVKGTLRHDFNINHIFDFIENDKLDGDDTKRILVEALHVIGGLRYLLLGTHSLIDKNLEYLSNSGEIWMGGSSFKK